MRSMNFIKNISNLNTLLSTKVIMILSVAILLLSTSCNKFLDVRPEGELPEKQLLTDANGFEAALFGVYGSMNSRSLYGENLSHNATEVLAQYFVCPGNNNAVNLGAYNYGFSSVESLFQDVWSKSYSSIAYTNNVLKNLERFSPQNLEYYNIYKGEALGFRLFLPHRFLPFHVSQLILSFLDLPQVLPPESLKHYLFFLKNVFSQ